MGEEVRGGGREEEEEEGGGGGTSAGALMEDEMAEAGFMAGLAKLRCVLGCGNCGCVMRWECGDRGGGRGRMRREEEAEEGSSLGLPLAELLLLLLMWSRHAASMHKENGVQA